MEPSKFSKKFGRMQTFEYKLLNILIQGSAGDNIKQAIINYDAHPKREARFLLTVHDQNLASCPKGIVVPQMRVRKWGRIIHISSIMGFISKGFEERRVPEISLFERRALAHP